MIKPGKYLGKVVDYGIRSTKAGEPEVLLRFAFDGDKEWNWRGSLKEGKAREITLKALIAAGFLHDDPKMLKDGTQVKCFDETAEVELVLAEEMGQDGKMYTVIKYVNQVGGAGFKDLAGADVVAKMDGMNLKADMLKLRQMSPVRKPVTASRPLDEIPF